MSNLSNVRQNILLIHHTYLNAFKKVCFFQHLSSTYNILQQLSWCTISHLPIKLPGFCGSQSWFCSSVAFVFLGSIPAPVVWAFEHPNLKKKKKKKKKKTVVHFHIGFDHFWPINYIKLFSTMVVWCCMMLYEVVNFHMACLTHCPSENHRLQRGSANASPHHRPHNLASSPKLSWLPVEQTQKIYGFSFSFNMFQQKICQL